MRKLDITHDCHKFLQTLAAKQYRQVVTTVLALLTNPEPHDSRPLTNSPFRRVDCGEYRVVYRFDTDTVYVPLVGKRNDDEVYKKLRRLSR